MIGIVPSVLERSPGLIDLAIRNTSATHYRISAHRSLNDAHSGGTTLFTIQKNTSFRSKTLRQKGLGLTMDSNRGLTRMVFDLKDYADGGGGSAATVPMDDEVMYLRVEESMDEEVSWLPAGPIMIIPPAGFYRSPNPALVIAGTAPNSSSATSIGTPASSTAMHIIFPKFTVDISVRNHGTGGAGTGDLWYSVGHNHPVGRLEADDWWFGGPGAYRELLLEGDADTADFSINMGVASRM